MIRYRIVHVSPLSTRTVIAEGNPCYECMYALREMLEQRFMVDTRIAIILNDITEEAGNILLENTKYELEKH